MYVNKAVIIIIGPVCSGKTTLCSKLHKDLNINHINESNSEDLFGIINRLSNEKETIIIEHSEIIKYIKTIQKLYTKIIAIYLDVSIDVLLSNYNFRVKNGAEGDFKNINISEMKQEIDNSVKKAHFKTVLKVTIKNKLDYENQYSNIKQFIIDNLEN